MSREELVGEQLNEARGLIEQVRRRWAFVLGALDEPIENIRQQLLALGYERLKPELLRRVMEDPRVRLVELVQDGGLRISWKTEIRAPLREWLVGPLSGVLTECEAIHKRVLKSRVFIALHMHAGDGNVHTNIPVNSDDYGMLQDANAAVAQIMQIARDLNGVISGEHGIGITKYEFLTQDETAEYRAYKSQVDPNGRFNAGKLLPGGDLHRAYTPSFNLLGHESLIMKQSDIGSISAAIKDCLRCGKCKPVCATHVPRANLLYSPPVTKSWRLRF